MQNELYDKHRYPIKVGDTLKIYHFTGARRKRYYMYKFVKERDGDFLFINHLDGSDDFYIEKCTNIVCSGIEIVQGYAGGMPFDEREKKKL